MTCGRTLFANLARGDKLPRPAFLPLLEDLAVRVASMPPGSLRADPGAWAGAVRQATTLVKTDALCLGFDPAIELEGDVETLVEALRQGFAPARAQYGCIAALTGPATLASRADTGLDSVRPRLVAMMERVCEQRPDMVVLMETAAPAVDPNLRRAFATLRKVAAYYDVATALHVSRYAAASAAATAAQSAALGLDYFWLGRPDDDGVLDLAAVAASTGWRGMILPLPLEDTSSALSAARVVLAAGGLLGFSSIGPVRADADLAAILQTRTAIGGLTN